MQLKFSEVGRYATEVWNERSLNKVNCLHIDLNICNKSTSRSLSNNIVPGGGCDCYC